MKKPTIAALALLGLASVGCATRPTHVEALNRADQPLTLLYTAGGSGRVSSIIGAGGRFDVGMDAGRNPRLVVWRMRPDGLETTGEPALEVPLLWGGSTRLELWTEDGRLVVRNALSASVPRPPE